jgi:hypothetical protein
VHACLVIVTDRDTRDRRKAEGGDGDPIKGVSDPNLNSKRKEGYVLAPYGT